MNFIVRHDHLGCGYRVVTNLNSGYDVTDTIIASETNVLTESHERERVCRKGSRVSTDNDWLQIKIGGNDEENPNKKTELNRIRSTRYTVFTFLPQNLMEQFRRIANFYFLVITIVSLLIDSPVSPLTSLLPLLFVVAVTAAKQGYEDYLRYRTDNVVNNSLVTVIRDGTDVNIQSENIVPGDLVVVEKDCDVPCDLVILYTSDPHNKCFITTANLDGESNLKTLLVPRNLPKVEINQLHKLGSIECESATPDLYSFNGKLELANDEGRIIPLNTENILLRGCRVKHTECIIGCAVYTGMDTKLQRNSRSTPGKISSSESYINRFLVFILVCMLMIVTLLYFLKRYEEQVTVPKLAYLGPPQDAYSVKQFLQDYLSFLILFNYLIPISLYVTIELHRVIGSFFMEWDLHLYDEITDEHCIVNTSNLNEELGQVNFLFSDKTGTLTKNEMIFKQCSINGKKYICRKTRLEDADTGALIDITKFNNEQRIFFQALVLCHTVQVANVTNLDQTASCCSANDFTQKYSISNITEESQYASQQNDTSQTFPNGNKSQNVSPVLSTNNDANPLLHISTKPEPAKRPIVVKRSPNFTRPLTRVHPKTSSLQIPTSMQNLPSTRPSSMMYQRSTSEIELADYAVEPNAAQGHRRSQSYGTSSVIPSLNITSLVSLRHASSSGSRESYATPSFRRQPTLMYRNESQRRKKQIERVVNILDYQASSPDEKALVDACANLGLVYTGDDNEVLNVRIVPPHVDYTMPFSSLKLKDVQFNRLHVLEFSSDRKRMSVILKDSSNLKWIYTKGAESYVFPLCSDNSSLLTEKTNVHISEFARQGLRTLAVARRRIDEEEYVEFLNNINAANSVLENRKELLAKTYAKIERNLDLLGATAVEDALQDGVADTLVSLQKAGIKIWVLTGDKVETALNIAVSCGHIPQNSSKYFIINCANKDEILVHLSSLEREIVAGNGKNWSLLIDGQSLAIALASTPNEFRDISIQCLAVLCCRLSPLQKSEVVSLIRSSPKSFRTAAIGDGANDVSMIQEAHLGIGIMGKEGRQAARCSDFAIAKFNMLKRLVLIHGHYHSSRLSVLVLYFFYKNVVFMGNMFIFQFFTLFSSSSIYDSLFLTFFNVCYTSLPIFFISLTEKPFSEERLINEPELYEKNINNKKLQWQYFVQWILYAVYHSIVIYFFAYLIFIKNDVILNIGQTAEFSCFGVLLIEMVVVVANLKLWLESKYMSYLYIGSIVFSIVFFVLSTLVYNIINLNYDTDIYWSYNMVIASLPAWFYRILTVATCLLPDFTLSIGRKSLQIPKRYFFPGSERRRRSLERRKAESTNL